ncbi:efflux RND transporter periplasmic adaptor subunit [Duganella sp. FT92W]|uniref:Efflux RND transporter periplasmic adaptor subunit n=1 Tax=Pseudoduganella rivuli TaxID=2666085 RepID=A0A7X2LTK7_9BURK|nr:efflux RND transporter periplasmic adaptor subunit [Pseudoduganella rivuli]MRV71954.1 efflux RND transporter periplasmic adaptor subunit [Pseudoduganella rivuli]
MLTGNSAPAALSTTTQKEFIVQKCPSPRHPLRILIRAALVPALLPLFSLTGCSEPAATGVHAEPPRPAYVVTVTPKAGAELEFVGEVRAVQRAELSFAVAGQVATVLVEPGDHVRPGQVLATLHPQQVAAQTATARSDLARAEAQLAEVRQRHDRIVAARASGAASAAELHAVQAELGSAEATLRSAHAQRDAADWSLEQARLRAPMDGTVSARHVEPGQGTGPGAPAFTLDGAGRELSVLVPGDQPAKAGQPALLRSGDVRLDGKVLRVASRLEAGGLRRVFLSVPERADVGSAWRVSLTANLPSAALQIPLRAVQQSQQDRGHVLRVGADGHTVEQVTVRLGALHGDSVEIEDGLRQGDRVIVAGALSIQPGSKVAPFALPRGGQQ